MKKSNFYLLITAIILASNVLFANQAFSQAFDLAAGELTGPTDVMVAEEVLYSFTISNEGSIQAYSFEYFIELRDNSENILYSTEGVYIDPGQSVTVEIPYSFPNIGDIEIKAFLNHSFDENQDNNTSNILMVNVGSAGFTDDLVAGEFTGPAVLEQYQTGVYSFTYTNEASVTAYNSSYSLQIIDSEDNILSTTNGTDILPGEEKTVNLDLAMTELGLYDLSAHIDYGADQNTANNTSEFISVQVIPSFDLSATNFVGPTNVTVDVQNIYEFTYSNTGFYDISADSYTLDLIDEDDNVLASVSGEDIAVDVAKTIEFSYSFTSSGTEIIRAKVNYSDDVVDNNTSEFLTVTVNGASGGWVNIGDGQAYDLGPMYFSYYVQSIAESVYPEEIIGANYGDITSLKWYYQVSEEPQVIEEEIRVWLGVVEEDDLSDSWIKATHLQMVYEGTFSMLMGENEMEIIFDEPFTYAGGNLAVMVVRPNDPEQELFGDDKLFKITETGTISTISNAFNDGSTGSGFNFDPYCEYEIGGVDFTHVPNISFNFEINADAGLISGIVNDENNQPIVNATLTIPELYRGFSDENGVYDFSYILPGSYELTVEKDLYFSQTVDVVIDANGNITQDFTLAAKEIKTITGHISSNIYPDGLVDVKVKLKGYEDLEAITNSSGDYTIENVVCNTDYNVMVMHSDHQTIYETLQIEPSNTVLDYDMGEWTLPTHNVSAEIDGNNSANVDITWNDPFETEDKSFILDDGSAEWVSAFLSLDPVWVGNYFPATKSGAIDEIQMRGFQLNPSSNPPLNVEIFSENFESIYYSDEFILEGDNFTTITFDPVKYNGGFYVMMKYNAGGADVNGIGWDNNGPNVEGGYGRIHNPLYDQIFMDPKEWSCGIDESRIYLIRAFGTGAVQGDSKSAQGIIMTSSSEDGSIKRAINPEDVIDWAAPINNAPFEASEREIKSSKESNAKEFVGYNIYSGFGYDDFDDYTQLNDGVLSSLSYTDTEWDIYDGVPFKYAITVVYTNGLESEPAFSNTLELEVGIADLSKDIISFYPNPTADLVNIELNKVIDQVEVYNNIGSLVFEQAIGAEECIIDMSTFKSGVYQFKLISKEETIIKQLIKE